MGLDTIVVTDLADIPDNAETLHAIHVKLDGCDKVLRFTRTKCIRKYGHKRDRRTFVKSTFPLLLVS